MKSFPYTPAQPDGKATIGMVVLQTDETLEHDFQRLIPADKVIQHVTRIPNELEVSCDTLATMKENLPAAASLFPHAAEFAAVGYGCTSGTAVIGPENIARLVKSNCNTLQVSEPVSALVAACQNLNLSKIAFLSPYVEEVSATLRDQLRAHGIETPVFGSFNEGDDQKVVRIGGQSIIDAATELGQSPEVDAIFLSCTNLRTLDVIAEIEANISKPVLSSNQVLAWHLCKLASVDLKHRNRGTLLT